MELEVPKEPLSPDAVEALMKQRKEARRLQHEQEAAAAGTTSAQ
jgi:hypothetical protein